MRAKIGFVLCLLFLGTSLQAQESKPLSRKQSARVESAFEDLIYELDNLQETIVDELEDTKEKRLYGQTDAIMSNLLPASGKLNSQKTRQPFYDLHDRLSKSMSNLRQAANKVESLAVKRSTERVHDAFLELYYQIAVNDESPQRQLTVLKQQIDVFANTASKLKKTAEFALKDSVVKKIGKLAAAAKKLNLAARLARDPNDLKNDFASLDQAWAKVVADAKLLPPRKNVYLLRSAANLDRLHARLFRLLGMKGERNAFSFRI